MSWDLSPKNGSRKWENEEILWVEMWKTLSKIWKPIKTMLKFFILADSKTRSVFGFLIFRSPSVSASVFCARFLLFPDPNALPPEVEETQKTQNEFEKFQFVFVAPLDRIEKARGFFQWRRDNKKNSTELCKKKKKKITERKN